MEIPRSTFYHSQNKSLSKRAIENQHITTNIISIHKESKGTYGAPKIQDQLLKKGFTVSLKRVQRLMKAVGISSVVMKKFKPYPSQQPVVERKNILNRDFSTTSMNEKWVADITYIHTIKDGWCYLASILDLHTKKIVGYSFSKSMTASLVVKSLDNAVLAQSPSENLILHTDLGTQYTSDEFQQMIAKYKIVHSFSQKGCPYDNACIESFHATLKKEEVHHRKYVSFEDANKALFEYIEGWYNLKRIHSSIGYQTPQEFENSIRKIA